MLKLKENFSILLLSFFLIRLLITGASVGDAIALLALSALFAYQMYLEHNKEPEINTQVKEQLTQVKSELNEVKSAMQALKLGTQIKSRF